ncbi:AAA family ATPase [Streptosporangium sp. NPDC002544]|uniref:nucleotide-binding protein n=1 Tax=Streptosporangium sp. NPDC002544 TaxID=3154538 RepID=UPI0033324855
MARHDREESLEEQLAWLDAIKEQEEAPALAVQATTVDDTVVSPYPKDPWSLVPAEPDTASSPLFRAAVDSAHPATSSPTAEPPVEDADAADWLEASDTVSSFTVPAPASGKQDNDGFLAPLKPLPRQEAGDSTPGDFTEPHIRTPFAAPAHEPSRGLFEQPQRQAESSDPAPSSTSSTSSAGTADPEPATPASSDTQRFTFGSDEFGGTDPGRFSFGSGGFGSESFGGEGFGGGGQDRAQSNPGGTAFSFGSGDFSVESAGADRPAADAGGDLPAPTADRFTFGSVETDRFPTGGESTTTPTAKESSERFAPAPAPVSPPSHEPEQAEPFRAPDAFGTDRPEPAASPSSERSSGTGAFGFSDSSSGQERTERENFFAPSRESGPSQERGAVSGWEATSAQERMERENPFAPGRDAAEPVREPYQARRRQTAPAAAFGTPARQHPPGTAPRPSADSLDPESLLRGRRNAPAGGWRKLVYKASAGLIKPGESPEVRRRRELVGRARTPVATGHHRVAVLSLKGGVGKTTTTVGLGATLAQVRGDRVIAVDANPDRGTLSDKVELETSATVRDLLNERQQIKRYVDIRAFTSQAPSRLEILASDRDPSVSEAFSASDYQSVAQVLENFYSICITDCGTGLLHSAMSGVLGLADQLVLVSSPSVDGARAASATLDWLEAHHYEELVRSATVVLCSVRPRSKSTVDLDRLEAHFAARCRAVIRVPYDTHLEEGAEIDLERLQPATRESYLRLAASVGDGFAGPQP